jgi:hypothetical protein
MFSGGARARNRFKEFMKKLMAKNNILKNQKGFLTLDFIFATIMMFAFSAVLFAFSITFTSVEIAQYATFASARAHFAAHKNEIEQKRLGKEKFEKLIRDKQSPLGHLFRNGWFTLSDVQISDFSGDFAQEAGQDSDTFVGARTTLIAKILQLRFPMLGSTTEEDLSTDVSSYLMREPTEEECSDFTAQRFDQIQNLKSGFGASFVQKQAYAFMMDDGC